MLSIDTAVGGAQCDLLSGPGLDSLMRIVQTGIITGSLSGPPHETWSAARHLQLPPQLQAKWPRPLRSSDRGWGIAFLTQRELQQLATGSALMLLSSPSCFRVVRHSRDPREPGLCQHMAHSVATSDLRRCSWTSASPHPTVEVRSTSYQANAHTCNGVASLRLPFCTSRQCQGFANRLALWPDAMSKPGNFEQHAPRSTRPSSAALWSSLCLRDCTAKAV